MVFPTVHVDSREFGLLSPGTVLRRWVSLEGSSTPRLIFYRRGNILMILQS